MDPLSRNAVEASPDASSEAEPAAFEGVPRRVESERVGPGPEPITGLGAAFNRLRASARSARSLLSLRSFDTETPEGRSKERYRRAALTTLASMLARGLGIFTGLAWIRISLSYLGKERYGLWMALGSLVTWASLADLGLARGLQNHLSRAHGKDDRELASRYVSTGLFSLAAIALVMALIATPVVLLAPWGAILNLRDAALSAEARDVALAVVACFLMAFPLSVVPTIYAAYQRGYVASLFSILGSLTSLATLVAVTHVQVPLSGLVLATGGVSVLIALVNFAYVIREMPWLRPRLKLVSVETLRALAGTSAALFIFQIGSLLVNETQSFIIARRLGISHVADWSVFMRVHVLPAVFIQMIDAPLIPAFREAHVRGEHGWLRTAFWRVTTLKMVIATIAAGLYFVLGNDVAGLLSGKQVSFPNEVWAASGFLLLVAVWNTSFNDLLIAVDRLWLLVITVLVNGLVTPVLSYFLAPSLGLFGVVLATPVFSLVVSAWLLPLASRDLWRARPSGQRG